MREEAGRAVKGDTGLCAYGVIAVASELCVIGGVLAVRTVEGELGQDCRT